MNNLLLDSHIFMWLLQEPHKVGGATMERLQADGRLYISLAAIWELGLKHNKGKLAFSAVELLKACESMELELLPIITKHILQALDLKITHKDPFDVLIIAQAKAEGFSLLTADQAILELKLPFILDARK